MRRSLQVPALTTLFEVVPFDAPVSEYRRAVIDDNVLGQASASGRVNTWKPLRSLYRFEIEHPPFRALRRLWDDASPPSRALLALLYGLTHDPILRGSASAVVEAPLGEVIPRTEIVQTIEETWPSRFSAAGLGKIAQYVSQSWEQAGYLDASGARTRPEQADAYTAAFALLLGHLSGSSGAQLTTSPWFAALSADAHDAKVAARQAQSLGLIEFRSMGGVSEFGFAMLLAPAEPQQGLNV